MITRSIQHTHNKLKRCICHHQIDIAASPDINIHDLHWRTFHIYAYVYQNKLQILCVCRNANAYVIIFLLFFDITLISIVPLPFLLSSIFVHDNINSYASFYRHSCEDEAKERIERERVSLYQDIHLKRNIIHSHREWICLSVCIMENDSYSHKIPLNLFGESVKIVQMFGQTTNIS